MNDKPKGEETLEAIKRMGVKVFEITAMVVPNSSDNEGKIPGVEWEKLLGQYKNQKIRVVIEKIKEVPNEI